MAHSSRGERMGCQVFGGMLAERNLACGGSENRLRSTARSITR